MMTFSDLHPLAEGLPPVAVLSYLDSGGSGMAALEIFQGLRAAGVAGRDVSQAAIAAREAEQARVPLA